MNRIATFVYLFILMPTAGVIAGEKVALKGEVVDASCYFSKEAKGKEHKKCAEMCFRNGAPAALLTNDGKVYLLTVSHDNAPVLGAVKDLAAERVEIKGEKIEKGGMAAVMVESVRKAD